MSNKNMKNKTISTTVAAGWLTRYKNEMTDNQFKEATKKLLTDYRIYIPEYDKIPEDGVIVDELRVKI